MATLTVTSMGYIRPARAAKVQHRNFKEEASQTFKRGAVVIQDATTKDEVEEAGADAVAGILGIADQDATGVADTMIGVALAGPNAEFVAHIQDSATTAVAQLGTNYGLVYDSSNTIWRVDTSETTNVSVTITGFWPEDAIGDTNGRVIFKFMPAVCGIDKN